MARFVLREDTQLVREIDLHAAAMEMAKKLGIRGQVETRAGDYRTTGWTTGFMGHDPRGSDVLLEVYAVPLSSMTLSMAMENEVLRAALNQAAGEGADEAAIEAFRTMLTERDARMAG